MVDPAHARRQRGVLIAQRDLRLGDDAADSSGVAEVPIPLIVVPPLSTFILPTSA